MREQEFVSKLKFDEETKAKFFNFFILSITLILVNFKPIMYLLPQVLKQFIFDHRPDLIVLNSSGGQNSLSTAQMVTGEIVPEVAEMIKNRAR